MDASDHFANAAANDLCPLEGRRTVKELEVKLFVVYLTTVAAFAHVQSIRNERVLSWRLAFYVLLPSGIFAWCALVLLALLGVLAVHMCNKQLVDDVMLQRAPRWILGVIPQDDAAYQQLPTSETAEVPEESQQNWKRLGRIILAGAFLVQCIGTIVLYSRRRARQAVTLADQRVFELGCTGLLTAMHWICILLNIPLFTDIAPRVNEQDRKPCDHVMIFLRDSQTPSLRQIDSDLVAQILSFYKWSCFCYISPLVHTKAIAGVLVEFFDTPMVWVGALILSSVLVAQVAATRRHASRMGRFITSIMTAALVTAIVVPLGTLGVTAVPWSLYGVYDFWARFRHQNAELVQWPKDSSCPLLWSDPKAAWVWALA
jgi:hypothetical protein